MLKNNPLLAQLKQDIEAAKPTTQEVEGFVKGTERGFGFLETESGDSFFIPPKQMKRVMHGDKIAGEVHKNGDRDYLEPTRIIEQRLTKFVGRVKKVHGKVNVVPDNFRLNTPIRATARKGIDIASLNEGDWVSFEMKAHPLTASAEKNLFFKCVITELVAENHSNVTPWNVTLAHHDLPNTEPEDLCEYSLSKLEEALEPHRVDLTAIPFVTIDGESTKDMDDAIFVEQIEGGFKLMVAIADPSAYIELNSDMDIEAKKRCFTTYLPAQNVPMLPRTLSDNLCSLREGEERLAVVLEVTINDDGVINDDAKFSVAKIKSHARLVYNDVSNFLEGVDSDASTPEEWVQLQLKTLENFALIRAEWREKNAIMFPDKPDSYFSIDDEFNVTGIDLEYRRIGNRIVEEAMIASNECNGRMLAKNFGFGVYNTQLGFDPEKMEDVMDVITESGAPFSQSDIETLEGFAALRRWLNSQETSYWDNRLRKFQLYGETSLTPVPHFAMGLPLYATWTSPIRKYGDIVNHRLIKAHILGIKPEISVGEDFTDHVSDIKRAHKRSDNTISDWLYSIYLQDEVGKGKVWKAEVFDVNKGGARVRINDLGAAAFLPKATMCVERGRIFCQDGRGVITLDCLDFIKLGDTIDVQIADVDVERRQVTVRLDTPVAPKPKENIDLS
ncbi:Exoribonuclease 2 [Vibrio chagasii]|nr:Exoribonuclease 2 [Vibrio chagasii]